MPRGNRTGPRGLGPMTGRGMDYFAEFLHQQMENITKRTENAK